MGAAAFRGRKERQEMEERQDYIVAGYSFKTKEDAKLAEAEAKKVEYIEQRMNYERPERILAVYKKAVEERMFQTPVGMSYMEKLHDFLINNDEVTEPVPPIPLHKHYSRQIREVTNPAKKRIKERKKRDELKMKYMISLLVNIVLVVLVLLMFYIAIDSDNPNVINYEHAVTNKYAEWEQELTEREKAVREKEKELNITETN